MSFLLFSPAQCHTVDAAEKVIPVSSREGRVGWGLGGIWTDCALPFSGVALHTYEGAPGRCSKWLV